jgi:two-component system OmpR family sensor kinase
LKNKFQSAWERVSLRAKLTALSVGLIGLLLTVSSAGTVALLSTYLQRNTDTLLIATAATLASENPVMLDRRVANGDLTLPSLPSDYYIAILNSDGKQFLGLVSSAGSQRITPNFSTLTLEVVKATEAIPFEVEVDNLRGPNSTWRIVALPLNRAEGSVVVALPINTNQQIISEYGSIGGRFGIFLLVLSGLSIWLTITSALKPLREVERTSQSVKAGQFSSRLVERHDKTEIGRLNRALNSMLDSIESAVRGKDKTLEQMRRFVSDASHELRTPLVTVRGYAELYRMGAIKKPKDVAEAMDRIESEAIRMSGLVESLLTLTRMDELDQLTTQKVKLESIATPVIKDASVANPDVKFELEDQTKNLEVELDADRMKQVLTNLVGNASRFAPKGSTVTVLVARVDRNIKVSVIDRGDGIPEPLQEKVFDRFYRADNSRNRETGGSGLGLAIARSIVNAHGGKIWAEATVGGGATFSFEIPISQS